MNIKKEILNQNTLDSLFNHWKVIPAIKVISDPAAYDFADQEIRSLILRILREGIEEDIEGKKQVRHVFSVKEIHKSVKKFLKKKKSESIVKLSNSYFHLDKLEKKGYVQIVTSIKEGRYITYYYGRTARLFLFVGEKEIDREKSKYFQQLNKLINHFNPDRSEKSNRELLDEYVATKDKTHERVKKWIETNEEVLLKLDCDLRDVYNFLVTIDAFNHSIGKLYAELAKLFNYP
ncbi:MAG: hypothetical protein ACXADA_23885 [Candidatus Hodarchaeales archaeon]|jgi:hypothetical protein